MVLRIVILLISSLEQNKCHKQATTASKGKNRTKFACTAKDAYQVLEKKHKTIAIVKRRKLEMVASSPVSPGNR